MTLDLSARSTRARARLVAATAAFLSVTASAFATPVHAQGAAPRALTGRISGSVYGQGSDPRGDFGKNTGSGWGLGASGVVRIDPTGIFNWRADLGFLTYGNSTRRIPLAGTGGLIRLDLKTSNNIFSAVTGPQIGGPIGAFTPYAAALGGFSVFWTESTVEGTQSETPFASSTNSSDAALTYGGAAGLLVRVYNGARPIRLDLGARLLRHDNVKYLTDERVREAFENDRDPIPVRGRADFLTYYIGVNAILY